MNARPARDRLAVWTYEEAGEEIPHGDPSVTDAERSAAGRDTITARWQALLPGNRSRASSPVRWFRGRGSSSARSKDPGSLRVSPAARAGRSPRRSAGRTCSARWPRSAPAWSPSGSAARLVRPGSGTTSRLARSSRASAGPPGSGRSGCGGPGSPAVTRNGSAATITSGGNSSSRSRWAGCSHRHEHPSGGTRTLSIGLVAVRVGVGGRSEAQRRRG
jgi:hypothetical protein